MGKNEVYNKPTTRKKELRANMAYCSQKKKKGVARTVSTIHSPMRDPKHKVEKRKHRIHTLPFFPPTSSPHSSTYQLSYIISGRRLPAASIHRSRVRVRNKMRSPGSTDQRRLQRVIIRHRRISIKLVTLCIDRRGGGPRSRCSCSWGQPHPCAWREWERIVSVGPVRCRIPVVRGGAGRHRSVTTGHLDRPSCCIRNERTGHDRRRAVRVVRAVQRRARRRGLRSRPGS